MEAPADQIASPEHPHDAGVGVAGAIPVSTNPWVSGRRSVLLRPELGLPLIIVCLGAFLAIKSEYFLEWQNLMNVTDAVAYLGVAAAFATIVAIAGGIDLTPVVVMVTVGIVAGKLLDAGVPLVPVIVISLVAACSIGLLNGVLISVIGLNSFIVTLGTNFLFTGVAFVVTNGQSKLIENEQFTSMFQSTIFFKIPTDTVAMFVAIAFVFFLLRYTKFGTYVFAVGGNEAAARLSGVSVRKVKIQFYVLGALGAGIAGIILASNSGAVAAYAASGANADLLTILAAVIIGGTALTGGRGSVIGTACGILLLGMITNGLVLLNISSFWQPVVTGVILLLALILDEFRRRVTLAAG
jgi:ribose transport system permease protein